MLRYKEVITQSFGQKVNIILEHDTGFHQLGTYLYSMMDDLYITQVYESFVELLRGDARDGPTGDHQEYQYSRYPGSPDQIVSPCPWTLPSNSQGDSQGD